MARDHMNDRLDEEVRFHIDMATERNIRMGMNPEEARRKASLEFGAREHWKEEARNEFRSPLMAGIQRDIFYAFRSLRHHRGFTATAVLTLALGIGASTAIFSVVNAVLLRPLPYADAGSLALIWGDMRARNVTDFPFSPGNYLDFKRENTTFSDVAALTPGTTPFTVQGEQPEQVKGLGVTPNLLSLLGARVLIGRGFIADDATPWIPPPEPAPGAAPTPPPPPPPDLESVVILNHDFWRRRFGANPAVVGTTVDMGGETGRIVGVLSPGFEVLFPPTTNIEPHPELFWVMRIDYERASRLNVFMRLVGRIKSGVSLEAARQDAERQATAMREKLPIMKAADSHYRVEPMHDDLVQDVRPAIFALMGAVVFVLLIACANVANLLLVRAVARERELAVRAALGSSPWRIVRQLMAESLLLSVGGALLGLVLAWAGIKLLMALAPANLPRLDAVNLDIVVLAYASVAAVVAAALFGTVPALRASRPDLANVLRASGRTPGLGSSKLLRNGVILAEVALSFVLLVGGGLMVRSFIALARTDSGFDPRGAMTFSVPNRGGRSSDERAALVREMRDKLAALPGVQAVTAVTPLPLGGGMVNARWGKEDAVTDATKFQQANVHIVIPGYFEAMGTKLIEGRTYTEADNRQDFMGIVIDDALAKQAFPGERAVGKRLYVRAGRPEPQWLDIIGVVQHQRHESLASPGRMAIFFSDGWYGNHGIVSSWVVRLSCARGEPCDPTRLASGARRVVQGVDSRLPVADMKSYQQIVDRAMTPTRFALVLIGVFAAVAALLTCVGLYSVLSTAVRQRTSEIGVRMAFGATNNNILGLVMGDGMKLSGIGLLVGLVASFWLTRAMTTMLVGVSPTDPTTYTVILGLFVCIAMLACWIPARRAAAMDPTNALRSD